MKILFSGSSSFTGYWFLKELSSRGHDVVALFRKSREAYEDVRRERVTLISKEVRPVFNCVFGSDLFFDQVRQQGPWDAYCHHAAEVTGYKSMDFDASKALENNTYRLRESLAALQECGCRRLILTGSVFEPHEGAGSEGLRAVSPYGLSKGLTSEMFRYYCQVQGMPLAKFVIPNPFGPYEEKRFTSFLAETWCANKVATVEFPDYVRDNIHVSLLAKAYAAFVEKKETATFDKLNPSGYVESQGAFAKRFAEALSVRLGWPCDIDLREQSVFREPLLRINTEALDHKALRWNEAEAWDSLAEYYRQRYQRTL